MECKDDSDGDLDMEGDNENDAEEDFCEQDQPTNATSREQDAKPSFSDGPFPEGAVKRAAEKAARSFQSTQPKVILECCFQFNLFLVYFFHFFLFLPHHICIICCLF
ncbi:hypothetical protein OESDEN_16945 [Oesophagostomum dentatum]|uniref:Uncharacterized protein n=1 Tax=Oesophagostomum dentatum TaxID=61180 RepID=A0A0B1SDH0_OESDE|nr:hypothetical protein OESDEN_16945 [Oesophagostomum dentatum]